MYWKHNNPSSPQIEAVLNKEDVTLHDLMDEEDILQECKSQNKKLIEFLIRPEVMEELVTLTTVEPSKELDERLRYKYSNIACELLTSDVPALNERLANDGALLGKLYYFLESDPPLNPLLASYFSKTLSMLVSQRTEQDWYSYQVTCLQVLEFLKSKENFVSLLVKHLGTSAIMDLMLKLITNIDGVEIKQNILNWLDSEHIVQSLIELLHPSIDSDRQCNAAQLLSDIIARSRDSTLNTNERSNSDPIIATLESSETVTLLLNNILGSNQTESSIVSGIQVLLALLNFNKNTLAVESNYEQIEVSTEKEHRERVINNVNTAIISRLKDFHHILIDPPKKAPIQTTVGLLDPPFGYTRLQVTKLLAALLASNSIDIKNEIAKLGTVNVLLDLFFKYTWNNFLHTQVQNCIAYALVPVTKIDEYSENVMYYHIIVECRLLGRILEAWDDNEQIQSQKKGVRRGYMGHLINIASNIAEQWDKTPLGDFIVANVNSETIESWKQFVSGPLEDVNKKYKIILGGVHPNSSLANDNSDDYREIPFPGVLQTSYTDFSRLQASTSQYIEVYGYNDEEDAQACSMFDKVCAETMNSFGNVDDEDDLWENQGLSSMNDKQHKEWQHRNSDSDDPMITKLDATIVDPWKTDEENFTDTSITPLAEPDPWSTNSSTGATVGESWANFDAFNNFDTAFNNMQSASNTSNFFDTFTQQFDFNDSSVDEKNDESINFRRTSSPEPTQTPQNSNQQEPSEQQQTFVISERNEKDSFDSDNNANINQNSKQSPDDELIDNFHTYLSNALTINDAKLVHELNPTAANDVTMTEHAPELVVKNSTDTTDVSQKVQEKLQEITTVHENESTLADPVLNQVTEAN